MCPCSNPEIVIQNMTDLKVKLLLFLYMANVATSLHFIKSNVRSYSHDTNHFEVAKSKIECASQCITRDFCEAYKYIDGKCTLILSFQTPIPNDLGTFEAIYTESRALLSEHQSIKSSMNRIFNNFMIW